MVTEMKWALLLLSLSLAGAAELAESHTVFLLPMSHGLDQFIASRLARMHVLDVVTDPAKADTVLTDRVGAELQTRLDELYPPPAPPKEAAKPVAKEGEKKEEKKEEKPAAHPAPPPFGDTANKLEKAGNMATFGRGKGTIFLVDVKSRRVLWSAFDKPKNFTPQTLDQTAARIVKRLKDDLAPKK